MNEVAHFNQPIPGTAQNPNHPTAAASRASPTHLDQPLAPSPQTPTPNSKELTQ
jgi:hypothetical protein